MKIKVIETAWYKKAILREDQIIDYDGDKVPVWGTLADGDDMGNISTFETDNNSDFDIYFDTDTDTDTDTDVANKSLKDELETLKDLAVENDKWLDIDETLSLEEQIAAFKQALKV